MPAKKKRPHLCPWWFGPILLSPLRRLAEKPEEILGPLVSPGMTVLEIGPAMGYFSLPLARMVGVEGRVVCVDVQQSMLNTLVRRARRRGLDQIIEPRLCSQNGLGVEDLSGRVGLVTALHVVHETENPRQVITECAATLAPGGHLVIAELRGHVKEEGFAATCDFARASGLVDTETPHLKKSFTAVFKRPRAGPVDPCGGRRDRLFEL